VLADADVSASNTAKAPGRVAPRAGHGARVAEGVLHVELLPRSWNVVRVAGGDS